MKKVLLYPVLMVSGCFLIASPVIAETLEAVCGNLMFIADKSTNAFELHMKSKNGGYALVSTGKITLQNANVVQGELKGANVGNSNVERFLLENVPGKPSGVHLLNCPNGHSGGCSEDGIVCRAKINMR